MKKIFFLLSGIFLIASCENNDPLVVTDIQLDNKALILKIGDKYQLNASHIPIEAKTPSYIWESTNSDVVRVTENGSIEAVAAGYARVNITTSNRAFNLSSSCEIRVNPIEATKITLNQPLLTLVIGDTYQLSYNILPENTTFKDVVWSSANQAIATVADGKITAKTAGKTTVNVKAANSNIYSTCELTVEPILATQILLNRYDTILVVGQKDTLKYTIRPDNTTFKDIIWESDNSNVVTVNSGVIKALNPGVANIKVKLNNVNVNANCKVTVNPIKVTGLQLNKTTADVRVGETLQLLAIITPNDATNKSVKWTTSNPLIASVNNGNVTALAAGEVIITGTSEDGSFTVSCQVKTFSIAVTGISLNQTSTDIEIGKGLQLMAAISPNDASNKSIKWSSSNLLAASVSNGMVTGIGPGTAIITATTEDGLFTTICQVNITPVKIKTISLNSTSYSIYRGETVKPVATITPLNASENVVWSSSNTNVVKVDSKGLVTPVNIGNAEIYASNTDRSVYSKCTVVIVDINSYMNLYASWSADAKYVYSNGSYLYSGTAKFQFVNSSAKSILLTKFEVVNDYGTAVVTITNAAELGILGAGQSKTVEQTLSSMRNPKCRWYYTLNNIVYTVERSL